MLASFLILASGATAFAGSTTAPLRVSLSGSSAAGSRSLSPHGANVNTDINTNINTNVVHIDLGLSAWGHAATAYLPAVGRGWGVR